RRGWRPGTAGSAGDPRRRHRAAAAAGRRVRHRHRSRCGRRHRRSSGGLAGEQAAMKFTVVTILPELVEGALTAGVVAAARKAGTIAVATINPRDFTTDKHRSVDDTPYGGGPGMVMKPEPLLAAIGSAGQGHRIL